MNKSKYGEKLRNGNMMYGPGCCAHTVTHSQIEKAKEEARKRGHFRNNPWSHDNYGNYEDDRNYEKEYRINAKSETVYE